VWIGGQRLGLILWPVPWSTLQPGGGALTLGELGVVDAGSGHHRSAEMVCGEEGGEGGVFELTTSSIASAQGGASNVLSQGFFRRVAIGGAE
jgi:hypothetical protein